MRKFLAGLIIGIVITVAAIWYYGDRNAQAHTAREDLKNAATHTKDYVQDKLDSLNLTPENIKDELARTGKVVRQKAENVGNKIADATADARITATIKAKLVANPDLSALDISVNTTNGRVTLSGTVASPERIAEAIRLAYGVDGVTEVVSTLQVKS
jgi:osmotically-inducible protein OsmY